jgi:HPt (histidine-containing phosphotransfer) domain-containing protein
VETVQNIRALGGKFESLTIIALTANAVKGAREMFLANGFNDFLSKPIDADRLREIVQKYLPAEKVHAVEKDESHHQEISNKEQQLLQKSIVTFVKENRDTFKNITDALNAGDLKTAHRIAHTLKSGAGYLGKTELQAAAFALEESLRENEYTPELLKTFEDELNDALRVFEPIVEKIENEKTEEHISPEEIKAVLAELKPLLEQHDFNASSCAEKLQNIPEFKELYEFIDNYDFEGALEALKALE